MGISNLFRKWRGSQLECTTIFGIVAGRKRCMVVMPWLFFICRFCWLEFVVFTRKGF